MTLAVIMKLLHIVSAFGFIAGIIGRNVIAARSARMSSFEAVAALFQTSEIFERLVIFSSMAVFILGILTALLEGWPLLGFVQGESTNWVFTSVVLFVVPFVAVAPLMSRRIRERRLAAKDALSRGVMTPEFAAALSDPPVRRFRTAELIIVAVIVVLMVTKPF